MLNEKFHASSCSPDSTVDISRATATCYVDVWSLKSMMSEEAIAVTNYNQIFFVK